MPVKRPETLLERAFAALTTALDRAGVPFMVVGGIAVIAHGVKRLTTDIDAVVQGGSVELESLVRSLARAKIEPRIDHVEHFARANLVLLMRHMPTGIDLDISLAFTRFELEALAARRHVRFGSLKGPMARPEDLVIFKALAQRPKDIGDATSLLVMHRDMDLDRIRTRVAELALLAEAPELIEGLETIIADAARVLRTLPKRPRKTPPRASPKKRSARSRSRVKKSGRSKVHPKGPARRPPSRS